MNRISDICKELKYYKQSQRKYLENPVSFWSEPDKFDEEIINAFVIILKTKGCTWAQNSGCSMCGYYHDSAFVELTDENLLSQYQKAMNSYQDEPVVKIFTSGSYFDTNEISINVRKKIITDLSKKTKKIVVESRPEYIKNEVFADLSNILSGTILEIGIGLETANDTIREQNINKGFSYKDYLEAANILKSNGYKLKTYVLMKPPFLTENQAIHDTIDTINTIKDITDTISLNPVNVQKGTLVEHLWKSNYYRPPWLWSILQVLTKASIITNKRLQCDIVGGGSNRGPHNCKYCDKPLLKMIRNFSLSQNPKDLIDIECECKIQWKEQLKLEPISFGSLIDIQRGLI